MWHSVYKKVQIFLKYLTKSMPYISRFFSISPIQVTWSPKPVCSHFLNIWTSFHISLTQPNIPKTGGCLALSQFWKVAHTNLPTPGMPLTTPFTVLSLSQGRVLTLSFRKSSLTAQTEAFFFTSSNPFLNLFYGIHITRYRQLWA